MLHPVHGWEVMYIHKIKLRLYLGFGVVGFMLYQLLGYLMSKGLLVYDQSYRTGTLPLDTTYYHPQNNSTHCLKRVEFYFSIRDVVGPLAKWVECLPRVQETKVQSHVESYQRLKKWYLMPTCLTLSIIKFGSRVKWSNPWNAVASSPTPRCCSYWKGILRVTFD